MLNFSNFLRCSYSIGRNLMSLSLYGIPLLLYNPTESVPSNGGIPSWLLCCSFKQHASSWMSHDIRAAADLLRCSVAEGANTDSTFVVFSGLRDSPIYERMEFPVERRENTCTAGWFRKRVAGSPQA